MCVVQLNPTAPDGEKGSLHQLTSTCNNLPAPPSLCGLGKSKPGSVWFDSFVHSNPGLKPQQCSGGNGQIRLFYPSAHQTPVSSGLDVDTSDRSGKAQLDLNEAGLVLGWSDCNKKYSIFTLGEWIGLRCLRSGHLSTHCLFCTAFRF